MKIKGEFFYVSRLNCLLAVSALPHLLALYKRFGTGSLGKDFLVFKSLHDTTTLLT